MFVKDGEWKDKEHEKEANVYMYEKNIYKVIFRETGMTLTQHLKLDNSRREALRARYLVFFFLNNICNILRKKIF